MAEQNQPEQPTMRRSPQRARGQQRVGLILDTAEQLFARRGYEATTTNELAALAGIPVGSIYQFFPNKEAILHALLARYRQEFGQLYEASAASAPAGEPLADALARLLRAMIEYGGAHMGFTRVVLQAPAGSPLAEAADALTSDLVARLEALLAANAPALGPQQRQLYAHVGITAVNAIIARALAEKHTGNLDAAHTLLDQAGALLVAYLDAALAQAYLGAPPQTP